MGKLRSALEIYLGIILIFFCIWQTLPYVVALLTGCRLIDLETGYPVPFWVAVGNAIMNGVTFPVVARCGWQFLQHGLERIPLFPNP
jgi:hypothetical protein